jgi:hypothetical protein
LSFQKTQDWLPHAQAANNGCDGKQAPSTGVQLLFFSVVSFLKKRVPQLEVK